MTSDDQAAEQLVGKIADRIRPLLEVPSLPASFAEMISKGGFRDWRFWVPLSGPDGFMLWARTLPGGSLALRIEGPMGERIWEHTLLPPRVIRGEP